MAPSLALSSSALATTAIVDTSTDTVSATRAHALGTMTDTIKQQRPWRFTLDIRFYGCKIYQDGAFAA